ncbi:serine/threonine protein kinase [Streptomyces sp. 1222.5]|uniref:protein kinase n=1 Tax=unclassified Streptomyces TaxID=2593676 RepID=UPI000899226F|nr:MULTISPECIES: protein kinase [unclassified Streptomyces]PKW09541.1 serine/threonine protein kinase [Streptomyces sp. 5112.2]SEC32035.1 serine/threonine protein kinase [Streptomyces sp. 1222.5]
MDDYAGRVLADRYRLPLPPSDEYELTESRAFDTYSGQEVLVRQVPLPEVVEAEVLDAEGLPEGFTARARATRPGPATRTATRRPADPAVRRAVEAAQAAARIPDHPRLDQVFDVFAEGGSLWVVSELVAARPLSALLADKPLTPYRAAEVAADVLMALRVLHAHGWVHRNITARTVLVCDDGRVMLTGLAVGAAEEALCGYDPVPAQEGFEPDARAAEGPGPGPAVGPGSGPGTHPAGDRGAAGSPGPGARGGAAGGPGEAVGPGGVPAPDVDPEAARRAAIRARAAGGLSAGADGVSGGPGAPGAPSGPAGQRALESGGDIRAARAGAIAAYRAGARAAARVQEAQQNGRAALPGARPPAEDDTGTGRADAAPPSPYATGTGGATPPGRIADPYGVQGAPWHGAAPRTGTGATPPALGGAPQRAGLPPGDPHTGRPGTAPRADLAPQAPDGPGHRSTTPALPAQATARWGEERAGSAVRRGPGTALAAERARQVRMTVVGPVTERWAPEQAGPVHENWQLAAPVGPETDLWALGALLFRAVQGHAPYPEESTAELVQLVCAEPPAFAEECGPLRPVVESLLRQDPTDRLDFEELSGWLRSLVRSAPEPDAGTHVVPVPPADPRRLPIVRRRGELVRRRRAALPDTHPHGRHKRAREGRGSPRSLGRILLLLILVLLAGAVAYAMLFMPKQKEDGAAGDDRTGSAGQASPAPSRSAGPTSGRSTPDGSPSASAPATGTQTGGDPAVADGFTLRKDPDGFQVAVAKGWDRTPRNGSGQVVYAHGNFELILVPGRDGTSSYGSDPMVYQRDKEKELQPYRDSSWSTATGLRTIEVGGRTMAEGQFTWTDGQGRDLFVRNMAILIDGRYHLVQVRGPEAQRDEITRLYDQATATYRYTG